MTFSAAEDINVAWPTPWERRSIWRFFWTLFWVWIYASKREVLAIVARDLGGQEGWDQIQVKAVFEFYNMICLYTI